MILTVAALGGRFRGDPRLVAKLRCSLQRISKKGPVCPLQRRRLKRPILGEVASALRRSKWVQEVQEVHEGRLEGGVLVPSRVPVPASDFLHFLHFLHPPVSHAEGTPTRLKDRSR
jgi:hypothetical protein